MKLLSNACCSQSSIELLRMVIALWLFSLERLIRLIASFHISHNCKDGWWRRVAERNFMLLQKRCYLSWGNLLFVFRKYIYTHILNG
jgi:hypothetical protein